jgi:hypothetical protein
MTHADRQESEGEMNHLDDPVMIADPKRRLNHAKDYRH